MFLGDLRRTLTGGFLRRVTATGGFHSTSSVLLRLRRLLVSAWAVRGRSNRCKMTEQWRRLNWRRRSTGFCKETENSLFSNLPTSGCSSSGMFSKMASSRVKSASSRSNCQFNSPSNAWHCRNSSSRSWQAWSRRLQINTQRALESTLQLYSPNRSTISSKLSSVTCGKSLKGCFTDESEIWAIFTDKNKTKTKT